MVLAVVVFVAVFIFDANVSVVADVVVAANVFITVVSAAAAVVLLLIIDARVSIVSVAGAFFVGVVMTDVMVMRSVVEIACTVYISHVNGCIIAGVAVMIVFVAVFFACEGVIGNIAVFCMAFTYFVVGIGILVVVFIIHDTVGCIVVIFVVGVVGDIDIEIFICDVVASNNIFCDVLDGCFVVAFCYFFAVLDNFAVLSLFVACFLMTLSVVCISMIFVYKNIVIA